MARFIDLFINRRGWAALIPGIVMLSQLAGVEVTEDVLADTGDKLVAAASALLALWSLYRPKP